MDDYKLVTVIVLTYKNFKYIYDCIDSILIQNYPDIELIIADDCSNNFPRSDILSYINTNKQENLKNLMILENSVNLGTVKNLNNAYKKANGNYLIGLSNDDIFFNRNTVFNIVERLDSDNKSFICCRRLRCNEETLKPTRLMPGKIFEKKINGLNTAYKQYRSFALQEYYEMASGSALYFKREHFNKWGYFDELYRLWEDGPFFIQYTRAGNKLPLAYDLVTILYRSGGISSLKNIDLLYDNLRYYDNEIIKYINKFSYFDRKYIMFLKERTLNNINYGFCFRTYIYHPISALRFFINRIIKKLLIMIETYLGAPE